MKRLVYVSMVLLLVLSFALSACTPATPTSSSAAPTTSAKPATTTGAATSTATTTKPASTAVTPISGGTLKSMVKASAVTFGYPPKIAAMDRDYCAPFFDRLLSVEDDGSYAPRLATSWETSADGKTITFKLRKGVKFHDGTDFNAAAAKFNFDALIAPNPVILNGVTSFEVVDDYTLKVNLSSYNNMILYQIASAYECFMASPTAIQKNGVEWAGKNPVGTGPFKFVSYERNVDMIMVKFPDYWEKGLPYLDGIQINTVADSMTQLASFKAGQSNAIFDAEITAAAQLRDAGYTVLLGPKSLFSLSFDTKNNPILANKAVREAIEYAIDKDAICNGPGLGLYKSVYQIVDSSNASYSKDSPPRKYDTVKAKQLLAQAGYPNGFTFKINIVDSYWRDGIIAIQNYLAQVGIKMEINYITTAIFSQIRALGQIESGTACQMPLVNNANSLFTMDLYFRSNAAQFKYVVKPAGIDDLIANAKLAKDIESTNKATQQITKLLYDDQTIVPLWMTPTIAVLDKSVQNSGWFINNDSSNSQFGRSTWLKK
jgi:peptide/nickel transport system substrate-binding protein